MGYLKRLRCGSAFAAITSLLWAAGCSMHPLTENVSRASTYDIVERVRCEVKEALDEFAPDDRHAQRIISLSVIGFDFLFDMSEGNNIKSPKANESGAFATFNRRSFLDKDKGFSLDVGVTAERERQNTRRFRIIEDLGELNKSTVDCRNAARDPNRLYPVTGSTGMGEVVSTFIRLEKLTDLGRAKSIKLGKDDEFSIEKKNIAFSDVLRFTTRLSAGVNPRLTLTTVAGELRMTNSSFFGAAHRDDIHTVIVALASDAKTDFDKLPRQRRFQEEEGLPGPPPRTLSRSAVERRTVAAFVRDSRTATALVQTDASARNNVLVELQRLRDLEDDAREAPRRLGERLLQLLREPD